MGLIETNETNLYTFEPFAAYEFYTEVNRALVKHTLKHLAQRPENTTLTIVDMACGTGAVTRLVAEEMARQGRLAHTRIIGVDPSAEALRRAKKGMDETGLNVQADFVQGEAEDLPKLVQNADAAFFCNAIHLVPDKLAAFRQMASILAPKGIFGCNSAFHTASYVPGTERFYRLWIRRAMLWLKQEHPEVRTSREQKAMAMQWISPQDYIDFLKQSGFPTVETETDNVSITLDGWRDLSQYWLFIEGALPGIPLGYGAEALGNAVYEAAQELGITEVPRTWLQIVAIKND
jgi:ubiquinone/menaquinone biosynthesis C-methylase UbiE